MERTINRIFEIEEKARVIIDRTNKQKARLYDEFEQELTNMEKKIAEANAAKIKDYKTRIDKELREEESILIQKSDRQRKELDELYANQHNDLVNQVFESIIRS